MIDHYPAPMPPTCKHRRGLFLVSCTTGDTKGASVEDFGSVTSLTEDLDPNPAWVDLRHHIHQNTIK